MTTPHRLTAALADRYRLDRELGAGTTSVVRHAGRSRAILGGVAAVATLVVALAAWDRLRPGSEPADALVTRVAIALPAAQGLRPQFLGFAIGLSADGRRLAYVGPGKTMGTTQIWIRPL